MHPSPTLQDFSWLSLWDRIGSCPLGQPWLSPPLSPLSQTQTQTKARRIQPLASSSESSLPPLRGSRDRVLFEQVLNSWIWILASVLRQVKLPLAVQLCLLCSPHP